MCIRDRYKMLLRICASIYWFNPFLLIMLKEADKDIENLCDAAVVRRVNKKEHKLYRQLLLRTVAMENQIPYVTASLNAVSYTHLDVYKRQVKICCLQELMVR